MTNELYNKYNIRKILADIESAITDPLTDHTSAEAHKPLIQQDPALKAFVHTHIAEFFADNTFTLLDYLQRDSETSPEIPACARMTAQDNTLNILAKAMGLSPASIATLAVCRDLTSSLKKAIGNYASCYSPDMPSGYEESVSKIGKKIVQAISESIEKIDKLQRLKAERGPTERDRPQSHLDHVSDFLQLELLDHLEFLIKASSESKQYSALTLSPQINDLISLTLCYMGTETPNPLERYPHLSMPFEKDMNFLYMLCAYKLTTAAHNIWNGWKDGHIPETDTFNPSKETLTRLGKAIRCLKAAQDSPYPQTTHTLIDYITRVVSETNNWMKLNLFHMLSENLPQPYFLRFQGLAKEAFGSLVDETQGVLTPLLDGTQSLTANFTTVVGGQFLPPEVVEAIIHFGKTLRDVSPGSLEEAPALKKP